MRILLVGKGGQVGFELQRALAPLGEIVAVDYPDCDLADPVSIRRVVEGARAGVVVNAAAYTAVDRAESEPERARAINAVAPGVLVRPRAASGPASSTTRPTTSSTARRSRPTRKATAPLP